MQINVINGEAVNVVQCRVTKIKLLQLFSLRCFKSYFTIFCDNNHCIMFCVYTHLQGLHTLAPQPCLKWGIITFYLTYRPPTKVVCESARPVENNNSCCLTSANLARLSETQYPPVYYNQIGMHPTRILLSPLLSSLSTPALRTRLEWLNEWYLVCLH